MDSHAILFFLIYFIFKLYIIVLVLPNIKMNPPQVYMCSPSWTLLPPPSPFHPSGSSNSKIILRDLLYPLPLSPNCNNLKMFYIISQLDININTIHQSIQVSLDLLVFICVCFNSIQFHQICKFMYPPPQLKYQTAPTP